MGIPATELSAASRLLRLIGEGGITGDVGAGVDAITAGAGVGATAASATGVGAGGAIDAGAGTSTVGVGIDGVEAMLGEAVAGWEVALAPGRNLGGRGNGAGRGAGVATAAPLGTT